MWSGGSRPTNIVAWTAPCQTLSRRAERLNFPPVRSPEDQDAGNGINGVGMRLLERALACDRVRDQVPSTTTIIHSSET